MTRPMLAGGYAYDALRTTPRLAAIARALEAGMTRREAAVAFSCSLRKVQAAASLLDTGNTAGTNG